MAGTSAQWIEVRSPHYTVVSTGTERQARRAAAQLEQLSNALESLALRTERVTALLVQDDKDQFVSGVGRLYMVLHPETSGGRPFHDYVHYVTDQNFRTAPLWLREGLAEFFSNPAAGLATRLRGAGLLPLETLQVVDRSSSFYNEAARSSVFYTQSWALVHYLVTQEGPRFAEYLRLLRGDSEMARSVFRDGKALEAAFTAYVKKGQFSDKRQPLREENYSIRELPAAEAAALRGGFLAAAGRGAEARPLLEEALRLNPNLPSAYLVHYDRAVADPSSAEAAYRRSIDLNSGFAPAHAGLAAVLLQRSAKLEEALAMARRAAELDPAVSEHRLLAARILLALGRREEASRLAEGLEQTAAVQEFREQIRQQEKDLSDRKIEAEAARIDRQRDLLRQELAKKPSPRRPVPAKKAVTPPVYAVAEGRLENAECRLPWILTVHVRSAKGDVQLQALDFRRVDYLATGWDPPPDFNACKDLKGRPAKVYYLPVAGAAYAGELLIVELRREPAPAPPKKSVPKKKK